MLDSLKRIEAAGSADTLREAMAECHPELAAEGGPNRIAIVGAADEGRRLAELCVANGVEVVAHCDDNPAKVGTEIAGRTVEPTSALEKLDDGTVVIVASHRPMRAYERLRALGVKAYAQFMVLQVLRPDLYPPHMFYDGWLEDLVENLDQYKWLAETLADDTSRAHLDAILRYRLTGSLDEILDIIDWEVYQPKGLIAFDEHEVYVDGGAYDGDTIKLFIDRVGGKFDGVVAFEPDPDTYGRLCDNFSDEPRVKPVNKGLFSEETTLRFTNDMHRASIIADDGEIEIQCCGLDDVLGGDRATFIKMNIEGAELEALRGAKRTIDAWKPRLGISAYHRPTDLWGVPRRILEVRGDYALYLRQQDAGVIETVCYAI
jgi:FkbM family methyltransferase